jgi:hypothetical protein
MSKCDPLTKDEAHKVRRKWGTFELPAGSARYAIVAADEKIEPGDARCLGTNQPEAKNNDEMCPFERHGSTVRYSKNSAALVKSHAWAP